MRVLFLLIAIVLLTPVVVHAIPCDKYEYAELQSMDKKSFLKEYCRVRYIGGLNGMVGPYRDFTTCHQTMKQMERVYLQRFKIKDREELVNMCPPTKGIE